MDFNKYEIITSSGKTLQFTITDGNASSSDVKEIKNAIENKIIEQKPMKIKQQPPINLKLNKSCDNLTSLNDDSQSAFINYKNLNSSSQASLAKLKNHENQTFKRSVSLGQLIDEPERAANDDTVTPEMTEHLILKLLLQQLVIDRKQNLKMPQKVVNQPSRVYNQLIDLKDVKMKTMNHPETVPPAKQQYQYPNKSYYTNNNNNYYPLLTGRPINQNPYANYRYNNIYRK